MATPDYSTPPIAEPALPSLGGPQVPFVLKLIIVVYLLLTLAVFGACFVDLWRPEPVVLRAVFGAATGPEGAGRPPIEMFRSLLFSVVGGGLGGITFSLLAFNRHVGFLRDFSVAFAWGFFYSPWVAAVLGLVVFALVKGGLLVLSGGGTPASAPDVANLGHLSLGFLAGFGWGTFTEKLRRLIAEVFGRTNGDGAPRPTGPSPTVSPTGSAPASTPVDRTGTD